MIKAIAIDDEPVALDIIRMHAQKVPFIVVEAFFLSATEALAYLGNHSIDLVFLDIAMPDISGLALAAMIQPPTQIIFTTAYPDHALKGYELAVTDYLLKPVNLDRFLQSCKLAESRKLSALANGHPLNHTLLVKDGQSWVPIKLNNLVYAQAENNYVSLFETGKRTLTRMTLTELQGKLPSQRFMRIHKSYIIALDRIGKIEKHQITVGDITIPLSKLYKEALVKVLQTG